MQIQSGKLYENRTWKYLYPSLKFYGEELMKKLSLFFKLAVGVGDSNNKKEGHCIYILVDMNIPHLTEQDRQNYRENFSKFLAWVTYKDYFVEDYLFGDTQHMIVLKLPKQHDLSYVSFVNGKYSEMYGTKSINKYFAMLSLSNKEIQEKQNKKIKHTRNVLTKNKEYLPTFVSIVNKDFNTEVTVEDFKDAELDYPPKREEEIFNYSVEKAM